MTKREKNLAMAVGAILVFWGVGAAWDSYREALDRRRAAVDSARSSLESARLEERYARRAALRELPAYQTRSLPANPEEAQQAYRSWLVDELEAAGLEFDDLVLSEKRPRDYSTTLGYSVKAEGDLEAVTRFLYGFYETPLLQKLTSVKLAPREGGRVQLTFTVQTLALAGADLSSGVPEGDSGRPSLRSADAYVASLAGRDFFRPYVPPPPPRPPRPPRRVVERPPPPPLPKFDDAAHAYVTGIVQSGDSLQAWVTVRTTGEVLRLSAGDDFQIGLLDGSIESVTSRALVVRTDEGRFATPLGSHLRDGVPVGADSAL